MPRALLICGATGKQGGAVIKRLVSEDADFEMLAVTRNAASSSALRLALSSPRIKLVQGNLADPASLFEAARQVSSSPIWGVFSVQTPVGFNQGGGGEVGQGKALVDESIKAGVKFFVYTSVDRHGSSSIDNATDIPHFQSKYAIEHHLIDRTAAQPEEEDRMRWAILRPVAFMDNITDDFSGRFFLTTWKIALRDRPLQLVAVSDIGFFGANAFLHPEAYAGRALSLAGDDLTIDQLAALFRRRVRAEPRFTSELFCRFLMWAISDVGLMFKWFHDVGYAVDIEELRKAHPGLKSLEAWLETESQFAQQIRSRQVD